MEHFWHKIGKIAFNRSESVPQTSQTSSEACTGNEALCNAIRTYVEQLIRQPCASVDIYKTAFTHRSFVHDQHQGSSPAPFDSNQRLEFLGDAVLDLIISEHLYKLFPESDEGALSSTRSKIVNRKSLADFAQAIALGNQLIIGESADEEKIRKSEATMADAFEALIGAIYLDKGLPAVQRFIDDHVMTIVDVRKLATIEHNHKSRLIEFAQANQLSHPQYTIIREEGAEHQKTFTVEVSFDGKPFGTGTAARKKDAEQAAARRALLVLQSDSGDDQN
ncbi:ribonuclease III [Prosthecochloris sp. ZM]|uniref:ribonuclease III n=1 Tax=Prosthecochloris sp. ZM TaxID=2283143 RepID=UPI000DF81568|nr:ribonuclease III [Prosthecochloris sp. ZM]RDD31114.1 ribonuclease III [Prosthecochloris sp. ZM]